MWSQRLQDRLDGVIYFERNGEVPWIEGQTAVAWLSPSRKRAAMEERKKMAGTHTTPKYIDVLEQLIGLVTKPGDIVLDPFAGSGTTLIACQRTGRRFIGVELEPEYAERAVFNWLGEPDCAKAIVHREFADGPISFADLKNNPGWGDYEE
jgi:DNA modification methylase